ncbi:ChrR family anti-sigma-E factor [Ancylobacter lacus]|uniref:ChrR family anti-sigma-E factor n=1 Tax=Ancylobacter lacus TaxID=2579970 RepID=UPI001BCD8CE7|nr:ChrR family anti-sigma-E factor [Ancylobacter lacus]MBS7539506.1 ChrR family anti-sigma-E factor [Ancylobacter lacus]
MTIRHHPSDETLLRYAAGRLAPAPGRVVATHLHGCPACRERVRVFEAVGGAVLDGMSPVPVVPHALARALAAIDAGPAGRATSLEGSSTPAHGAARTAPPLLPDGIVLPAPLRDCAMGPWRWAGFGVRASALTLPEDPKASLLLLRVAPGRRLPEHGHSGLEFTQILSGSFSDAFGRYQPGDLTEMGAEVEHQPVVDPDGPCICLTALEGGVLFTGSIGRLIQPFLRL